MATIQIFHEETGSTYTVSAVLRSSILSDGDMTRSAYLIISTTIRQLDGSVYPKYLVKDLTDIAPGAGAATTFTELINGYIEYFVGQSQFGQSSSSSSTSSSSSSDGYSSSSSSSSDQYSSSSSSSGQYSSSSSSS